MTEITGTAIFAIDHYLYNPNVSVHCNEVVCPRNIPFLILRFFKQLLTSVHSQISKLRVLGFLAKRKIGN